MADFRKAMDLNMEAEFSKNPRSCLHVNKGEEGWLTYMGIFQREHPTWKRWGYT